MYLLDTNVVSEGRRLKPHGAVLAWIASVPNGDLHVSAVSIGELQKGIEATRDRDPTKAAEIEAWLDQLIGTVAVLPMGASAFRQTARLMRGQPHHLFADAMIAATAQVHGLTVATRNVRDFVRFGVPTLDPFALAHR
jgi:predicted nucleic acid-binding protein